MKKKLLIGSIVAVAIILITSTVGVSGSNIPQEELPDLSIRYVSFYSRVPESGYFLLYTSIINKGDTIVNESVKARLTMLRLLFGLPIIPIILETDYISFRNGIEPGEEEWVGLTDDVPELPGLYLISLNINYDEEIKESNYLNNRYTWIYFRGLQFWYSI